MNPWSYTDSLLRDVTVSWMRHADLFESAFQLAEVESLDERTNRLAAVELLGRAILQLDVRALSSVSATITGKDQATRACVVSILGQSASACWHEVDEPVRKLIDCATAEQHLAKPLVAETTKIVSQRQTNSDFAKWISNGPDAIAGYAWSVALRVAGEWLWDRSFAKIQALSDPADHEAEVTQHDLSYRPGKLRVPRSQRDISPVTGANVSFQDRSVDTSRIAPWKQPVASPSPIDPYAVVGLDFTATRNRGVHAPWINNHETAQQSAHVVITELPWMLLRRRSSSAARTIAVDKLLQAAISSDPSSRAAAWDTAMATARQDPQCSAWTAEVNAIRSRAGEPAWAQANQLARTSVQVLLNELPFVVDRMALITLAGETCAAAARAVAIDAGAVAIAGHTEVKATRKAALSAMAIALNQL